MVGGPTHNIILSNKNRKFSTKSNYPANEVFTDSKLKRFEKVIIFVHGFPDNNSTFDGVWEILAKSFPKNNKPLFLAPLLRGYERSSQGGPESEYSVGSIADDIRAFAELFTSIGAHVHLVGHDWGAIITYKTIGKYPELFTSAVTLAIPYFQCIPIWQLVLFAPQQIYLSTYFLTMQLASIYGPKFAQKGSDSYLDYLWSYWSPTWKYPREAIENVRQTLQKPGAIEGATAYYRQLFAPLNFDGRRWPVDFTKVPTLILGGETDGCMTKTLFEITQNKLAKYETADVKILSKLGHFLQREDPQKIAELIFDWISKYP